MATGWQPYRMSGEISRFWGKEDFGANSGLVVDSVSSRQPKEPIPDQPQRYEASSTIHYGLLRMPYQGNLLHL